MISTVGTFSSPVAFALFLTKIRTGSRGRLLDAEAERLGEADVQAFETEGLIGTPAGRGGAHLTVSSRRGPALRAADLVDHR
jgi:hypothetical protein